ncbi:hypothetical protein [Helicobacter cetorum]|uniref:hypothetical protein n=1 Tax=Helicobacter cetorum TaxID=138563 RepID=UPI000CF0BF82|nr:hypothetical protein [Helicobacter cetorum]
MRFKTTLVLISLAIALGSLAYLFLHLNKEIPPISPISQAKKPREPKIIKTIDDILLEDPDFDDDKSSNDTLSKSPTNYPVVERHFEVSFDKHAFQSSKLLVKDLEEYQFLCLKEILKQEKIEFAYDNTPKQSNMIIYLDDSKRERLLEDLKYYKIRYHAIP